MLAETSTDSNGYFKFTYSKKNNSYYPVIQSTGGYKIIGVPWDTNIYDLSAYVTPTCNIQVSLNVLNAYEEEDTLIIGDYRTLDNMAVPCPLTSGILYTAENFGLLGMSYLGEPKYINWFITPYNDSSVLQNFVINKYCNDTIYVSVDIY